jgi:hypothetical protein
MGSKPRHTRPVFHRELSDREVKDWCAGHLDPEKSQIGAKCGLLEVLKFIQSARGK